MTDREFAIDVVRKLQTAGYEALWAGGCVRDSLIGKTPKDYDVATSARPEQVRDLFGHKRTLPIGASFGVITVLGPKPASPIEVATFRRDSDYSDGRRPDSIEFTNAQEDASRRDFTINGMFYDPVEERVIDYVGGKEDLELERIRAIGNPHERIDEDKLRMLRGVRFAATFAFEIEDETLAAIQSNSKDIRVVSPERIGAEVRRMLSHENRAIAMKLLIESKLWSEILPDVVWGDTSNETAVETEFDVQYWIARVEELKRLNPASLFEAVLSVMFLRVAKKVDAGNKKPLLANALHDAWRLKNEERDRLAWIYRHAETLKEANQTAWSVIQPLLIKPDARSAIDVAEAIFGASEGTQFCRERLGWEQERLDPQPLLDGADLIELGIAPGPSFSKIIALARAKQLDGEISTRDEAVEIARNFPA